MPGKLLAPLRNIAPRLASAPTAEAYEGAYLDKLRRIAAEDAGHLAKIKELRAKASGGDLFAWAEWRKQIREHGLPQDRAALQKNGSGEPWIGVDLDRTLAKYRGWKGHTHIGAPVPKMAARVKRWLRDDKKVKIMTARASNPEAVAAIRKWLREHFGEKASKISITDRKDHLMKRLYDDRAVKVAGNEGTRMDKTAADPDTSKFRPAARMVIPAGPMMIFGGVQVNTNTGVPYLMLPGGGVDDGEDFKAAALREAEEEMGIKCTRVHFVGEVEWPWGKNWGHTEFGKKAQKKHGGAVEAYFVGSPVRFVEPTSKEGDATARTRIHVLDALKIIEKNLETCEPQEQPYYRLQARAILEAVCRKDADISKEAADSLFDK